MRALGLIILLILLFVLFQWAFGGETTERMELSALYVGLASVTVVVAHWGSPALRHDRAGHRLEFFAFIVAVIGIMVEDAKLQGPKALEAYASAQARVSNERLYIREIIDIAYVPTCDGWRQRAHPKRKEIQTAHPDISFPDMIAKLKPQLDPLDRACLLLWDARAIDQQGDYEQMFTLLQEAAALDVLGDLDGVIQELRDWSSDPYDLQDAAEDLRNRAAWITWLNEVLPAQSRFLLLLALSIGIGRTGYFAYRRAPKAGS